jgi:hypothetical protein
LRIDGLDHDPGALQRRQIFRHGVRQPDPAVFRQHQDGHAGNGLGHRVDAKDAVLLHRSAGRGVAPAERLVIHHLAIARENDHRAGYAFRIRVGFEEAGYPLEPPDADVGRRRGGQVGGQCGGRQQQPGSGSEERASQGRFSRHRFIVR